MPLPVGTAVVFIPNDQVAVALLRAAWGLLMYGSRRGSAHLAVELECLARTWPGPRQLRRGSSR